MSASAALKIAPCRASSNAPKAILFASIASANKSKYGILKAEQMFHACIPCIVAA